MGLPVNSTNIVIFDYTVNYNLGTQIVTLTNATTYQGGGAAATQGIDFKLTSPSGVVYHNNIVYGASADITPAAPTTPFTHAMEVFAGAVEYGLWNVTGNIKDGDGAIYTYSLPPFNICSPIQCDTTTGSNGCANPSVTVNCQQNLLIYQDKTVYTYQGVVASSIAYSVIETYPAISGLSPITATLPFYVQSPIYDGAYTFTASNTATYNFGNNTTITIVYTASKLFNAQCFFLCNIRCAYDRYFQDYLQIADTGSQQSRTMKDNLTILSAYLNSATMAIECGGDASDAIAAIEEITGQDCSCACGQGVQMGVFTAQNINMVEGCGDITIVPATVGNTTTFMVSDTSYVVASDSGGLTVETTINGCTKTYTFSICADLIPICTSTTLQGINSSNIYSNVAHNFNPNDALIELVDYNNSQLANIRTFLQNEGTYNGLALHSGWGGNAQWSIYAFQDLHLRGFAISTGAITINTSPITIGSLPNFPIYGLGIILRANIFDSTTAYTDVILTIVNGNIQIATQSGSHTTSGSATISFDGIILGLGS